MKIQRQSFFSLLAISIIVSVTNPVFGKSTDPSEKTFFCQAEENSLATLAKTSNGENISIFNWNREAFPFDTNLREICDTVSEKLEDYLASEDKLSSLGFKTTKIAHIPTICLTDTENNCNLVLLTLKPAEDPIKTANLVLDSILNPQLKGEKTKSIERGVQSTSYTVSLWDLLGLNFR